MRKASNEKSRDFPYRLRTAVPTIIREHKEMSVFSVNVCATCSNETVVFGEKGPLECQSCLLDRLAESISPYSLVALETAFLTASRRLLGLPASGVEVQ